MNFLSLKQWIFALLNRKVLRGLLAVIATFYASLKNRRLITVSYVDGFWIHKHAHGILVLPMIDTIAPEKLEKKTRDEFLYKYAPVKGDVVIDVGAGVGGEILTLSKLVGAEGYVLAIEAHPKTYKCLKRMCELNELTNVHCLQVAVSNSSGVVSISEKNNNLENSIVYGSGHGVSVKARTLDEIVQQAVLKKIDFLKMNIEGAEVQAVKGMKEVFGMTKNLVISCHDFLVSEVKEDKIRTKDEIHKCLLCEGYQVWTRRDPRPWINDTLYAMKSSDSS